MGMWGFGKVEMVSVAGAKQSIADADVALAYLAMLGLLYTFQRQILFQPDRTRPDPARAGPPGRGEGGARGGAPATSRGDDPGPRGNRARSSRPDSGNPACRQRLFTMRKASTRDIRWSVRRRARSRVRNKGEFFSPAKPAAWR